MLCIVYTVIYLPSIRNISLAFNGHLYSTVCCHNTGGGGQDRQYAQHTLSTGQGSYIV